MKKKKPTEAELQVLRILWNHGPQNVRFVNDEISKSHEVGYTTTLKIMQIMTEKGHLTRDTSSKTHVYSAAVTEKHIKKNLLSSLVNSAFAGSTSSLVLHALGNQKTSPEELAAIKDYITKLENEGK